MFDFFVYCESLIINLLKTITMKKFLYFLLLGFVTILLFHSCNEEELEVPHSEFHETNQLHKRIISFNELRLNLQSKNVKSLQNNLLQRGGDDYIQFIDSTNIVEITYGNLTTYTLNVHTLDSEESYLSNLIIREEEDSIFEVIVHYEPSSNWIREFESNNYIEYEGEIRAVNTEGEDFSEEDTSGKMQCTFSIESVHIPCYGSTCPCDDGNGTTNYYVQLNCGYTNGGGGTGNGGDFDPDLPTAPHGGQGGGGSNGGNTETTAFGDFFASFTPEEQGWLYAHQTIFTQISGYLEAYGQPCNSCPWYNNQEAVDFALELVELLTELDYVTPNYTSSNYPGMNDGMPFNWWKNNSYLNNMSLDPYDEFNKLTQQEKILVSIWPEQAYKIYKNKPIAEAVTIQKMGYNGRNDKSDAFRHSFFNAINTRDINGGILISARDIVRMFGKAHESEVPDNLIKERQMDLFNNDVGINAYGF